MDKREFLEALGKALLGLPRDEIEQRIEFYSEMIDDRIEDGLSEAEAIHDIGSIDKIAEQITAEIPLGKIVRERIKPKKKLSGWNITLIILGFPLWLPLLISGFAVLLSLYICIWAVDISLWAVYFSFAASAFSLGLMTVSNLAQGNIPACLGFLGLALVFAGISMLGLIGCKSATKGIVILTKKLALTVKRLFVRKGDNND